MAEPSGNPATSLTNLPPTSAQRRFALAVVVLQFAACAVVAAFPVSAPRIDSFVPVILTIVFVAEFFTAILLFSQSTLDASRATVMLANGYLFSALIVVPHALTFPGAFAPKGLLGAGIQSSGWLNVFWHLGFLAGVAGYTFMKGERQTREGAPASALAVFFRSATIQAGVVLVLTWAVTAGHDFMPRLFLDDMQYAPLAYYAAGALVLASLLVLLAVWMRRTSVLDLWIMVAVCMLISEMALVTFGRTVRFDVGWYVARTLAVAVSTVVLVALLTEVMQMYARLSRANALLERERRNRLMTVQAATSSIAHEVRQALTGVTLNADAARKGLERVPPDVDTALEALIDIGGAGHRANEVLTNVRGLFGIGDHARRPVDVNGLILEALQLVRERLDDLRVASHVELASDLPWVAGQRVQLQEVVLNLVNNAIDAMSFHESGSRTLTVRTRRNGPDAIAMEVEDSGPGIAPERLGRIFEPFVTTKPNGTGLGLAICSMIVESHRGHLTASSDGANGALFQVILPVVPRSEQGSFDIISVSNTVAVAQR